MGRALVLGGGGLTGIAWTTGLLLGLADAGVDLTDLTGDDLVVGTSAGAAVGAQITTGRLLSELYDIQLDEATTELAAELDLEVLAPIFGELATGERLDDARRARVGAMALAAKTVDEPRRRAVIEARLGTDAWPAAPLRITAVDAHTGALVVFDGTDGVGLIDAVAASCAVPGVWPPVTIGDRRLIDGGVRSIVNADLAAGHDAVLLVVPLPGFGQAALDREVADLATTSRTLVLAADDEATAAMGPNPLDPTRRRPAAEAGRRQAGSVVDAVKAIWRSEQHPPPPPLPSAP